MAYSLFYQPIRRYELVTPVRDGDAVVDAPVEFILKFPCREPELRFSGRWPAAQRSRRQQFGVGKHQPGFHKAVRGWKRPD